MRYIGLTGNIASGKNAVAERLAERGATVIDADVLAREAVRPGTPAFDAIVARWGRGVVASDGTLDRAALRRVVFGDAGELAALNAIVHPAVSELQQEAVAAARARGDAVVVYMVPLLFEEHMEDQFDAILLVDAPEPLRLERLIRDRGLSWDDATRMIAAQHPAAGKRARASAIVDNDGSREALRERTDRAWDTLTAGGDARRGRAS